MKKLIKLLKLQGTMPKVKAEGIPLNAMAGRCSGGNKCFCSVCKC